MAKFLDDPSFLTKDKLKAALTANNVELPTSDQKKEVYVQLYLKNLTVLNKKSPPPDTFSSDDELPVPVVTNRSRSSGRKATRKTDKPLSEEVVVTEVTDVDSLQKMLDEPAAETTPSPPETTTLVSEAKDDHTQNGNTHSDQYSDKEDEEMSAPEPEPVPVVEKPVRSRGKTPVTVRASSRRLTKVDAGDQTPKKSVIEDILANEISTPTGISATCRRPIRGAAGRPVKPSDYWLDESVIKRTTITESQSEFFSSAGGPGKAPARRSFLSLLLRLLLLITVVAALYYAYTNVEAEHINSLKGLLDSVLDSVAAPLGIGSESSESIAADSGGK